MTQPEAQKLLDSLKEKNLLNDDQYKELISEE